MAISLLEKERRKRPATPSPTTSDKKKRRSGVASTILFPKQCMAPNSPSPNGILRVKDERQEAKLLITTGACYMILATAKLRNDEQMLVQIQNEDLIAKEFRMHSKCYREYTRIEHENMRASTGSTERSTGELRAENLRQFVENHVIANSQSVSLCLLTELYGLDPDNKRRRNDVKLRLMDMFGDNILFVTVDDHTPQMVLSKKSITNVDLKQFLKENDDEILRQASRILRKHVENIIDHAETIPWPPTPEFLSREDRKPPESLVTFILDILHSKDLHHKPGTDVLRYAQSIAQDVLYCASRGTFLTMKQVLLATGLHSLNGQKQPIMVLSRFSHCISYDCVRSIEAAWAELACQMIERGYQLPLIPETPLDVVASIFWWDNYDEKKENQSGGIHTTHGVGWQASGPGAVDRPELNIELQRSRSYKSRNKELAKCKVNPHKEPPKFPGLLSRDSSIWDAAERELIYWTFLRQYHGSNLEDKQDFSRFVGYVAKTFGDPLERPKSYMTFLPPIPNPITDYDTVMECIRQSQIMATQSNMKYVHIVADVGAAAKFYHVVWNNPVSLGNVIIHLGDMHAMMENFAVAGKFVEGSGFDEIVFHSGLCNSGTIHGLMSGKHYNNAWKVHETVMEALNRLFAQSYMSAELQQFQKFVLDQPDGANVRTALMNSGLLKEMYDSYMNVKAQCLDGAMGKTAQFWLTYIDLICEQMRLHFAINVNDLELRMASWNQSVRNYCPMNKHNYARYGSYYCVLMDNLDKTHPGAKEEIGPSCVSVCRNNYGIGQSIDGGGEQTYMRSSKSQGGIRRFSHRPDTYEKWVLNRPFAATMVDRLLLMADLDMDTDQNHPRKCLRPSQVKHSEILVQNVITTVTECFMNPFDRNLIPDLLYNLVSGKPLSAIATNCLLSAKSRGTELANEFNQRLVHNDDVNTRRFFDPIPRAPWKSFKESDKKVKITSASRKVKDVSVQRDILRMLAAKSAEEGKPIDFRVALTYPLAPVPLALATSDGALRKTVKSKLMDVLALPTCQTLPSSDSAYTVDVIAEIRSMVGIPNTFRLLAKKLLNGIPNAFRTVYLVCDRYDEVSIKNAEHHLRGEPRTEYSALKLDMKIPDFQNFLKNGKNKDQMLEQIEQVVVEERDGLGDRIIYFARGEHCTKITATSVLLLDELASDHIEADTKLCYMVNHVHSQDDLRQSVVKSPSGDVDIPIILVGNANSQKDILIVNGTGKSRKILSVNGSPMDDRQRKAMP